MEDQSRNVVRGNSRMNNLRKWIPREEVYSLVQGLGLEFYAGFTEEIIHSKGLLTALAQYYDRTNRCFIFNGFKIVFSMLDVLHITGLPINGKPVIGCEGDPSRYFRDAFGMAPPKGAMCKGKIKLSWLHQVFGSNTISIGDDRWDAYVRAYVLYVLGSFVLVEGSSDQISAYYLPLLSDLSDIGNYAWGAAALARFHLSMDQFISGKCHSLSSLGYIMMLFALEYIKPLRDLFLSKLKKAHHPSVVLEDSDAENSPAPVCLPKNFPLMVDWSNLIQPAMQSCRKGYTAETYRRIFQKLTEDMITWEPYRRLDANFFPEQYASQKNYAVCNAVLICFHVSYAHRLDISPKQFGFTRIDPNSICQIPTLARITNKGPSKIRNLSTIPPFDEFIKSWDSRRPFREMVDDDRSPRDSPTNSLDEQGSHGTMNMVDNRSPRGSPANSLDELQSLGVSTSGAPSSAASPSVGISVDPLLAGPSLTGQVHSYTEAALGKHIFHLSELGVLRDKIKLKGPKIYATEELELQPNNLSRYSLAAANKRVSWNRSLSTRGRTSIVVGPCVKNQLQQKQAGRRGKPLVPKVSPSDDEGCRDINAIIRKLSSASTRTSSDLDHLDPFSVLLEICKQPGPLMLVDLFSKYCDPESIAKVGEGTYGEAFNAGNTVCKIVPFGGDFPVNGEVQKKSEELLEEAVLSLTLNSLREFENVNACMIFIETIDLKVCQGPYDAALIRAWEEWDEKNGSENDHPTEFPEKQCYLVFVLQHGGEDLESFVLENFDEAQSLLVQVTASLAVAEAAYEFEHRDLHWGNILLSRNDSVSMKFILEGKEMLFRTFGLSISIIDFTLSRINTGEHILFLDLSQDPYLFKGPKGEKQSETFRKMEKVTEGCWEGSFPRTNVLWLSYLVDVLLQKKTFVHSSKNERDLRSLKRRMDKYHSAKEAIFDPFFGDLLLDHTTSPG